MQLRYAELSGPESFDAGHGGSGQHQAPMNRREPFPEDPIDILAAAWVDAGMRAPSAASVQDPGPCALPDCPGRPFVEIRTSLGRYGVCHQHFEAVKTSMQEQHLGRNS